MAKPLKATLPPDLTLSAGYAVRLNALDATTGAEVAGVVVEEVSFFVTDLIGAPQDAGSVPSPLLVPTEQPL